jgi:endogenous inhibitor of DNA gyrase (YacG/DUF329 family)
MGCYDRVMVPCPKCGEKAEFQSKSGECTLAAYELREAPADVLEDVNRHAPYECEKCQTHFMVAWADHKPYSSETKPPQRDWKAEFEEALESRRLMDQRETAALKKAMEWEAAYWALVKAVGKSGGA